MRSVGRLGPSVKRWLRYKGGRRWHLVSDDNVSARHIVLYAACGASSDAIAEVRYAIEPGRWPVCTECGDAVAQTKTESTRPTNEYLRFDERWPKDRKTAIVGVFAARNGARLGLIKWFGRWRQYAFLPEAECVFNQGCLTTINAYMAALMEDRRG